eukprot:CAMPEP_0194127022 /NCGR_PEP_ID=MMETSP0150-20130528/60300_1 /TAXON_ID=122233 /ORGANISM="Chaetoceros debilis, Strain MM31A-1" /LENGTH=635 /DNA_ID=CAMNT_0038820919 /DNA_START=190 /DNA_END=2098 /DNA_ORIENTATION=+
MSLPAHSLQTPLGLAVDGNSDDVDSDSNTIGNSPENQVAFDKRIIETVKSCRNFTVRPARIASELGISIEDATAELCGLLRAVGESATFTFEESSITTNSSSTNSNSSSTNESMSAKTMTMVFQFPHDFERKAYAARRKEDLKETLTKIASLAWRILKVFTAFGLILSLTIILISGMCAMVAVIVAVSRGGGGGGQGRHQHQRVHGHMRSMCSSLRQILWFYVLFGQGRERERADDDRQDPFMHGVAYDLALWSNMLFTSPGSIWFWMNAGRLRNRRQNRGWRRNNNANANANANINAINQGSWGVTQVKRDRIHETAGSADDHRGILSIAVEFLFGPTPIWPGPSDVEKWNLIERFILSRENGITLSDLVPFIDNPPPIMEDQGSTLPSHTVSGCLHILAHFNGVPISSSRFAFPEIVAERENGNFDNHQNSAESGNSEMRWESILFENQSGFSSSSILAHFNGVPISSSRFAFPEIVAERENGTNFDNHQNSAEGSNSEMRWESILYENQSGFSSSNGRTLGTAPKPPEYLHEKYHVLTKLSRKEFGQCICLNLFNIIGILLLQNAISKEGSMLEIKNTTAFAFVSGIFSLLSFYAKFFFCLPLARLIFVITVNFGIKQRNEKRHGIAKVMAG